MQLQELLGDNYKVVEKTNGDIICFAKTRYLRLPVRMVFKVIQPFNKDTSKIIVLPEYKEVISKLETNGYIVELA